MPLLKQGRNGKKIVNLTQHDTCVPVFSLTPMVEYCYASSKMKQVSASHRKQAGGFSCPGTGRYERKETKC